MSTKKITSYVVAAAIGTTMLALPVSVFADVGYGGQLPGFPPPFPTLHFPRINFPPFPRTITFITHFPFIRL